ncbi:MAG TPA: DUF2510 domain-containing protein [Acidimicrobiales bacterium]|nr:DUF2510 domain-containing protein [Acidimicrobiales bacterium]
MPDPSPVIGWYADPTRRHQHRFWDGQAWTSRVADDGLEASDPPVATSTGPRRRASRPSATGRAATAPVTSTLDRGPATTGVRPDASTPPPHLAGSARRRWPFLVAAAVLLGVAGGAAAFVVTRHHGSSAPPTTARRATTTTRPRLPREVDVAGSGHYQVTLRRGQLDVHLLHLRAGQTAVVGWRVASGRATVRTGISATTVDRLSDHGYVTGVQRASARASGRSFVAQIAADSVTGTTTTAGPGDTGSAGAGSASTDTSSTTTSSGSGIRAPGANDPTVRVPGFHGVVLGSPDTIVAPVTGDYAVLMVGDTAPTKVDVLITVRNEPTIRGDLRADSYNRLIAGPFHDSLNAFLTAYCVANPTYDRGACDRLQHEEDNWPVTGATPAPESSTTTTTAPTDTGAGASSGSAPPGGSTTTTGG